MREIRGLCGACGVLYSVRFVVFLSHTSLTNTHNVSFFPLLLSPVQLDLHFSRGHHPGWLEQMAEVGFLFEPESLVSTHGHETGMLEDFDHGSKSLARFQFMLIPAETSKEERKRESQARDSMALPQDQMSKAVRLVRETVTAHRVAMASLSSNDPSYVDHAEKVEALQGQLMMLGIGDCKWFVMAAGGAIGGPYAASHMRALFGETYVFNN